MSQIVAENLCFTYPGSYDPVFENASFRLDTDWRLGLIGRNGRGKTTLLRLLRGEMPYRGRIAASVQFDYFPYAVADGTIAAADVIRSVCPDAPDWRIERELSLLGMDARLLEQPFETLSGGEKTRMLLLALFLNEGVFCSSTSRRTISMRLRAKRRRSISAASAGSFSSRTTGRCSTRVRTISSRSTAPRLR